LLKEPVEYLEMGEGDPGVVVEAVEDAVVLREEALIKTGMDLPLGRNIDLSWRICQAEFLGRI